MRWVLPILEEAPLGDSSRRTLWAIATRRLVSVRSEILLFFWLAVALITGAVGTFLARNIDQIGHAAIIVGLGVIAIAGYAIVWRRGGIWATEDEGEAKLKASPTSAKLKALPTASPTQEAILLLAALILSADIGYFEAQYRVFGDAWRWHLLILAALHAATAYVSGSQKLLALAVTSLAAFFGVDRSGAFLDNGAADAAARLMLAAAAIATWRIAHGASFRGDRRISRSFVARRAPQDDQRWGYAILEYAAFHLAMIGAIVALFDDSLQWIALAALVFLATLGIIHARRSRELWFLVFSAIYLTAGVDIVILRLFDEEVLTYLWLTITTPIAIAALFVISRRFREHVA